MLNNILFWKGWPKREQAAAVFVLVFLVLSVCLFVFRVIHPVGNVVSWDVLTEMAELPTVIDAFRFGKQDFGVHIPSRLVTEQFVASLMHIDFYHGVLFLVPALLGLSLLLAAVTSLPRTRYLGAMTLFLILVAVSRLEMVTGGGRVFPVLVVVLYGALSYYLHAFRQESDIAARAGAFVLLTAVLVPAVALGSREAAPGLTFIVYTYPVWFLLSVVFLLLVATEIMAGLVWLSTGGAGRRGISSLTPFLVISFLYLFILLLMYLENTRQIGAGFSMVSPVFLALGAAIPGLWGFRQRYGEARLSFRSSGFWIYTGLFLVAAAFGGYVASQANDPVLEVLEDTVVNGQLAMSVAFLFYIVANFYPLFRDGQAVHRVLYKPLRFGLYKARILGFAGVLVLFTMQNLLPVSQTVAGYFNGLGDLRTFTGEYVLAEQYYKMALQQEFQNHKANYALGSLALRQGDRTAAGFYFRQATLKKPSPQAYAALSGVLLEEELFFDALFNLRRGLQAFPESGELANNLGALYLRTSVTDSAFYYLEKAGKAAGKAEVPATNLLALALKTGQQELAGAARHDGYVSWQANWLGYRNLTKDFSAYPFHPQFIRKDSLLSASGLAYVVNYSLNQARTVPAKLALGLADKNAFSANELLLASLYAEYYSGNKSKALQALAVLAEGEEERHRLYKKILGQWFLQLGLYDKADEQFAYTGDDEGLLGRSIAAAMKGEPVLANMMLDKIDEKSSAAGYAKTLQEIFSSGPVKPSLGSDSLYHVARKTGLEADWRRALKANPYDESIAVGASSAFLENNNLHAAYQVILNALQFNEGSYRLYGAYAELSLEQGLTAQAEEGAARVEELAAPADYQAFLKRYHEKRAFIEKQRGDFR